MPTRRDVLAGIAITGTAALIRGAIPAFAKAAQPATPVKFKVPPDTCDCHVHVFDPQRFPFADSRTYTPEPATVNELQAMHRYLGTERVVIAQPSVYAADNTCMLDAMKKVGPRARGVAVIDDNTTEASLDELHRAGVRGVRLIFQSARQTDPAEVRQRLQQTLKQVGKRKWLIQIYTKTPVIDGIKDLLMSAPVPVIFDHFGGAQAAEGLDQPGFQTLLSLVHAGKAYVKISAPYRSSSESPDFPDVSPLAKALVAANPHCVLWGSDWPHPDSVPSAARKATDLAPLMPIDDGHIFNLLLAWIPDAPTRKLILVENPARLYGF